jgi:hypothetical protein
MCNANSAGHSGDFMIELWITCAIGFLGSAVIVGLWMLRAVRPQVAIHRER